METIEFLDTERNRVAAGEILPSQYHEQIYIAWVEGGITQAEYDERIANIPLCPALIDGFVKS